jgi:hypothetical protein
MEKPTAVFNTDTRSPASTHARHQLSLGTLHSFVEIGELRSMLARLTAAEMLRMLMTDLVSPEP